MQIIIRIGPLRFGPVDALLCVRHVSTRLVDGRCPSHYVSLRGLDISLRNRNAAYQCRNPPPLVSYLPFERSLLGKAVFESVLIRPFIDLKQQFALLYKLVVVDVQANYRSFHLRCDSNEIGGYFRVVRAWLPMRFEKHNETQNNSSRDNGNAKLANRFGSGVLREFQFHRASSGEKKEPKSECKQGRQAGIHDYWRRERFFQVNRQQ